MTTLGLDEMVRRMIYVAKMVGAKTPREAASRTKGRPLTEEEWIEYKGPYERNWPLVENPHSIDQQVKRIVGKKPYGF